MKKKRIPTVYVMLIITMVLGLVLSFMHKSFTIQPLTIQDFTVVPKPVEISVGVLWVISLSLFLYVTWREMNK